MKKTLFLLFIFYYPFLLKGQNWQRFAGDSTLNITQVYFDSTSSTLYGLTFIVNENGDTIHTPSIWNGVNFNQIGDFNFSAYSGFPKAIISYDNQVYIGGVFNKYNGAPGDYFLKLNSNNSWDTSYISPNFIVKAFGILDDTLIVMGGFSGVGNFSSRSIVKYANSTWFPLETGIAQVQYVRSMVSFNDSVIFSGSFGGYYTVPFDGNVLVYYNDSLLPFAGGIDFGTTGEINEGIICSIVYNGELYVAGDFGSDFGRSILKWDGTTWVDIANSPFGVGPFSIRTMAIYNNELYIAGSFVYIGGVYASRIAKWDGTKWCGLGSYINGPINTMFVYNNELVISGDFNAIDGVYFNSIAKWVGGNYTDTCQVVGIDELSDQNIAVFPTLAQSLITINNSKGTIEEICLVDLLGRISITKFPQSSNLILDVSHLNSGVYFVRIKASGKEFIKKIIKL